MKTLNLVAILLLLVFSIFNSCKKQDAYLDALPKNSLIVPKTLNDCQLLLQNDDAFNSEVPAIGGLSSADEYYVPDDFYNSLDQLDKNIYSWVADPYPNQPVNDWNQGYNTVYYSNLVLETLRKIDSNSSNGNLYASCKGAAYFYRGSAFWYLLQNFAPTFDSSTAKADLGIPLRLSSDLNSKSTRANVSDSYSQVIADLKTATTLLPERQSLTTNPSKTAAIAFLSRVYLSMGDYNNALTYANQALSIDDSLFDFNSIIPSQYHLTDNSQFPLAEMLHYSTEIGYYVSGSTYSFVDSNLFATYDSNDLRKTYFFTNYNGGNLFTGTYAFNTGYYFCGVANDEVLLNRAECYARNGQISNGLADLNTLLSKRYLSGTFVPKSLVNQSDLLSAILLERRKELLYRGLRWTDLRRLNKDSRFAVTISRRINGTLYTLPPNDPRYVLLLPDQEIQLSGLKQNPR